MIESSTSLKTVLKENSSIKTSTECTIEYNMNSLIDGISVISAVSDTQYTSQITNWPSGKPNPFKKLFPVDSIVKPFRPIDSGVKYFILPTNGTLFNYPSPKGLTYDVNKARLYYPGGTTAYKYWISPKNTNADITVNYLNSSSSEAGNKLALSNKIVVKFEKYHSLPTSYTLYITKEDLSVTTVGPLTPASSGLCEVYFNGTSWSLTQPSEPVSFATPIKIKSIRMTAVNPNVGESIGVIELSARWIKSISSDIVSFNINNESSISSDSILPVGTVTANSVSLELVKYNQEELQYVAYNRESTAFDPDVVYLAKNVEIKPYINVYHSNGSITSGSDKYDKIQQGTFYINEFEISEFGEASVSGLDGAKYLMETVAPEILCEDYAVTAILRRLLDSIGFTNYKFNLDTSDTSVPVVKYWWTENTKTVWECIQELCRDIQMNAIFDEKNVLNFYSRDYIYNKDSRTSDWEFYYEKENNTLPNIISYTNKEVASANQVKILWQVPLTSNYMGTSGPIWESDTTYLSAGALGESITSTSEEFIINIVNIDTVSTQQTLYNFQGFCLIDSEIIEYDAIQYDYTPRDGGARQTVWISSTTDISKYRTLAKPGYDDPKNPSESAYFKPTGRYRVKKNDKGILVGRGALGTTAASHNATANDRISEWTQHTSGASIVSSPLNPTTTGSYKSFLTLSNNNTSTKSYCLASRSFPAITNASYTNTSITEEGNTISVKTYSPARHYSFGTSMFIQPDLTVTDGKYPRQGGGLGFFLNSAGTSGYFVLVETTASAAASSQKTVKIVRMKNGVFTTIADSQKTDPTTLAGIFANKSYAIDVKVKINNKDIVINAYINGFKITAKETATVANGGLIDQSNRVGLISHLPNGKAIFDYVYGIDMSDKKYDDSQERVNIYQGQFSNDFLEIAYGDILYNDGEDSILKTSVDEFGTVVREIVKTSIKFDSRPAYPLKWATGLNKFVKVLGSKISNFGGEAYVLNNTSTTIPLADGSYNSFQVYGNTLGQSGQLEYSTDESEDYSNKEPVIFESSWLQTESDVKALADWIKKKVINRGKIVNLVIFGNPILSVGDIVTVKYPYQGMSGTEKLIITAVSHSYNQGLETTISCRTL